MADEEDVVLMPASAISAIVASLLHQDFLMQQQQ